MNWTSYPQNKPESSGPYLASITRPFKRSILTFNYIAYYDTKMDKWFKYNPFSDDDEILQEIEFEIIGWLQNLATYLG